ncbi:MAG: hypothetical protein A2075_09780 [Geobacteraceae bacterium GWC2_58_44]|nr:MAG: hypothetical protein A2075_09780 [Geobacteraceae bacterium GWC2_58_44]HBG06995.1 hypothetical protein [Geobacter sp.]
MRKLTSFMIVLAVLALTSFAHAGERAGAFSISPFVGGYMFDEDEQARLTRNRVLYGLRLGYDVTDSFGVELVGHYVMANDKRRDKHLDAWSYRMDLLYNFMPRSTVVPYLAMGGGGQTIKFGSGLGTSHDGTFNLGGGVKFFMTDSFALRLDARHILAFQNEDLDDHIIHNWEYSAGLSFLFGGRPAAAAAVSPVTAPALEPQPEVKPEPPLEPVPAAEPAPGRYKYCITLQGEFDIDQAVIRPEYHEEIAEVGNFMMKYPTTTAVIEGHTDNVGTYNHNMDLSQRRAESVVNHLVQKFGIDRSRLAAKGYGFTRPIADNSTDDGRQKNRRMEAIIDCVNEVKEIRPTQRLCTGLVIDFDSGKADIKPQYRNEIARVADYLKQYPTTTALIEGHTDNTGAPAANMKLSQQRAENVVKYLVDNFGIDRSRLAAKGYGSTMRVAYNNTAEGRRKNRRINAVIDCVIKR